MRTYIYLPGKRTDKVNKVITAFLFHYLLWWIHSLLCRWCCRFLRDACQGSFWFPAATASLTSVYNCHWWTGIFHSGWMFTAIAMEKKIIKIMHSVNDKLLETWQMVLAHLEQLSSVFSFMVYVNFSQSNHPCPLLVYIVHCIITSSEKKALKCYFIFSYM